MQKGKFITIEGSDGAGKTTHIEFLKGWFSKNGVDVVTTREPGGTTLGEALREILLSPDITNLEDETELLLMFSARMQHLEEVISPALNAGKTVLCDRFTDATYAYQGGGRGISHKRIKQLEDWVQKSMEPDMTIVLDVSVEMGLERTSNRGDAKDRFEIQELSFKRAVRQVYLDRAQQFPQRIHVVDATKSIDDVQKDLIAIITNVFSENLLRD